MRFSFRVERASPAILEGFVREGGEELPGLIGGLRARRYQVSWYDSQNSLTRRGRVTRVKEQTRVLKDPSIYSYPLRSLLSYCTVLYCTDTGLSRVLSTKH